MELNIAYGVDDKFSKHAYISIISLLIHSNESDNINCYFLTRENNPWVKKIKILEKYFSNFKFIPIICKDNVIKNLETSKTLKYLNYATYYRFFIDNLEKVDKVTYLDSDTIALGNISSLYKKCLDDNIIGVVSDCPNSYTENLRNSIKLKNINYFNSGVMLIDLEKWREYRVSKKCLDLLKVNSYTCNDQDALNLVLENHCKRIEGKFNVQTGFFKINHDNFKNVGFDAKYFEDAKKYKVITHYTGPDKPWRLMCNHPCRWEYDKVKWLSYKYNLYHLNFLDFLILLTHTIEYGLFPYYETRVRIRTRVRYYILKFKKYLQFLKL